MDGIVAWKREKEKEKLAHRELSKLQTMDRRLQLKKAELAAFDDNESLAKEAKAQAMDMFEAETGRLPDGQPLAEDKIMQGPQIRKENLPHSLCPRCGFGIGWMKCKFHEGHAYMWCKAGYKSCSWKESAPIQPAASSSVPSTPPRKRGSAYVDGFRNKF